MNVLQMAAPLGVGVLLGVSALAGVPAPQSTVSAPLIRCQAHTRDCARISEDASCMVPAGPLFLVAQVGVHNSIPAVVTHDLVSGDIEQEDVGYNSAHHISFDPGIVPAGVDVEAIAKSENRSGSVLSYPAQE